MQGERKISLISLAIYYLDNHSMPEVEIQYTPTNELVHTILASAVWKYLHLMV
jgi:hypothetical protein